MKKLVNFGFWVLCAVTLTLAACQKNEDSPPPNATPPPCSAGFITPNCIPSNGYYPTGNWQNGAWYWPSGSIQPNQGNCGCNSGYGPVYGGNMGFACAPLNYMAQYPVTYYPSYPTGGATTFNWGFWNSPAQNTQWNNIPQNYYQQCASATAQGCDVRQNNCPNGGYCQPVSGGSTIGVCVRGP